MNNAPFKKKNKKTSPYKGRYSTLYSGRYVKQIAGGEGFQLWTSAIIKNLRNYKDLIKWVCLINLWWWTWSDKTAMKSTRKNIINNNNNNNNNNNKNKNNKKNQQQWQQNKTNNKWISNFL